MATDTGRSHELSVGLPVTPGAPDAPNDGGLTHHRGQRWKPGGTTIVPIPGVDDPKADQALRAREERNKRRAP